MILCMIFNIKNIKNLWGYSVIREKTYIIKFHEFGSMQTDTVK